jgi:hypothetical protein
MISHKLIGIVTLTLVLDGRALAFPVSLLPTGGLCINKVTGAVRVVLDKNGLVPPCHPFETSTALDTLVGSNDDLCINKITGDIRLDLANKNGQLKSCHINEFTAELAQLVASPAPSVTPTASPTSSASPTPGPSPGASPSPSDSPSISPSPAPTAQPTIGSVLPQEMVDANGNFVGYELDDLTEAPVFANPPDTGAMENQTTVMLIGETEFAVDATTNGFPTTSDNGLLEIYYDGLNCTGNAYMRNVSFGLPISNPLVISTAEGSGCNMCSLQSGYIFDSNIYYPAPPYNYVGVQFQMFDPTISSGVVTGSCGNYTNLEWIYGGPITSADFPLFTPPFRTQPMP